LDEDEWVGAASSGDLSCERRPWRERLPSSHTEWAVAVTGGRIAGTIGAIGGTIAGTGAEVRSAMTGAGSVGLDDLLRRPAGSRIEGDFDSGPRVEIPATRATLSVGRLVRDVLVWNGVPLGLRNTSSESTKSPVSAMPTPLRCSNSANMVAELLAGNAVIDVAADVADHDLLIGQGEL